MLREIIENYDAIVEFLEDLEKTDVAPEFIRRLNSALGKLSKYKTALEFGLDAAEAAEEVRAILMEWYARAYAVCEAEQANGQDYYVCVARVDRQWQATNVKATLDINNSNSVVRKTWTKWKGRLLDMIPK